MRFREPFAVRELIHRDLAQALDFLAESRAWGGYDVKHTDLEGESFRTQFLRDIPLEMLSLAPAVENAVCNRLGEDWEIRYEAIHWLDREGAYRVHSDHGRREYPDRWPVQVCVAITPGVRFILFDQVNIHHPGSYMIYRRSSQPARPDVINGQRVPRPIAAEADYNMLWGYKPGPFDPEIHAKHLSHHDIVDLGGLTVREVIELEVGMMYAFNVAQLHSLDNYPARGIDAFSCYTCMAYPA
jgi:hypothetical protein